MNNNIKLQQQQHNQPFREFSALQFPEENGQEALFVSY
jgi:hypothetical protein